ncbi:MAG: hypothetical protein HOW97_03000 [Catenulispora sp.]|nr:hypothetical protein [Catenulispora sp.]
MNPTAEGGSPGDARQPSAQSLTQTALGFHREAELAWLHSNELPVRLHLLPAEGDPVSLTVDLRQPRALGEAVIAQAAAGIAARAIVATVHVGDLYRDDSGNDSAVGPLVAGPPPGHGPARGEALITVAVWPGGDHVVCRVSDAHTDDHGTRLLPPRDPFPDRPPPRRDLPLAVWLAGLLPQSARDAFRPDLLEP